MTVAELIEELKKHDPEAPVILQVYGHGYHSQSDILSHGGMLVRTMDKEAAQEELNTDPGVLIGLEIDCDMFMERERKNQEAVTNRQRTLEFWGQAGL